jgi:hypothetical protein
MCYSFLLELHCVFCWVDVVAVCNNGDGGSMLSLSFYVTHYCSLCVQLCSLHLVLPYTPVNLVSSVHSGSTLALLKGSIMLLII